MSSTTRRWKLGRKCFSFIHIAREKNENVDHIRSSSPSATSCFSSSLSRQFASFSCSLFNREMLELCSSGEIKWSEILVERNNNVLSIKRRTLQCAMKRRWEGKSINSRWNNRLFTIHVAARGGRSTTMMEIWDLFLPFSTTSSSSQFNPQ